MCDEGGSVLDINKFLERGVNMTDTKANDIPTNGDFGKSRRAKHNMSPVERAVDNAINSSTLEDALAAQVEIFKALESMFFLLKKKMEKP